MRVTILGLVATVLLSCWTPRAMAQPPGRVLNDLALRRALRIPTFGDMAASVIRKGMEARDIVTGETRGVRDQYYAARDRFWESYPAVPCSVHREFVIALKRRDNLETALSLFPAYMTRMLGGEPMSGISEGAEPAFRLWADRVKVSGDADEQKAYQLRYLVARDFEEFRLAGRTPQGLGEIWPIMLSAVEASLDKSIQVGSERSRPYWVSLTYPYLEALEIVEVFGPQRVVSLFNRFAADSGPWDSPADSGELFRNKITFLALVAALEGGSDREYLIKQIRYALGVKHWLFGWRHAAAEYGKLVDEKGESAVSAAIQRVRGALREQAHERSLGNKTFSAWAQVGCTTPGRPVPHGGAMGCIRVLLGMETMPPAFLTRVKRDRLLSDEEVLRFELEQLPEPETSDSPGCDAQAS